MNNEGYLVDELEKLALKNADNHEYKSLGGWGDAGQAVQEITFQMDGETYFITFGKEA